LIEHCRAQLARFKVPKDIVFVDALPRNPSGKVLKRELRMDFTEDTP
jgi:acyl-CoA synthetase (AMP-forming)/AMP-acid ligase II